MCGLNLYQSMKSQYQIMDSLLYTYDARVEVVLTK